MEKSKSSLGIKGRAKLLVYLNHFITGWDDNIWGFALGLFLVEISPESLTLAASYGLAASCAVLVFGPVVGDWVDRTARLTVARVSVLVNNIALILCSLLVFLVIQYKPYLKTVGPNEALLKVCDAGIIAIAIVANLTNMARTTAIERDWIVEICGEDNDMLATLSATMRRISLFTRVLTPIVMGQLLGLTSHAIGAIAVAGWNFMTIFVEYFLLWKIYKEVPQLQKSKNEVAPRNREIISLTGIERDADSEGNQDELGNTHASIINDNQSTRDEAKGAENGHAQVEEDEEPKRCVTSFFSSCITLHRGWNVYRMYDVAFAGLSLSSLYLTVLGFDGITTAFARTQGLSAGLVGGLYAAAAGTGIIGTILYPFARRRLGLKRTGLYALAAEIASLTLCVISIWCPGSPFEPDYFSRSRVTSSGVSEDLNNTFSSMSTHSMAFNVTVMAGFTPSFPVSSANNVSGLTTSHNTTLGTTTPPPEMKSYISISLLMTGIIGARIGLYMADLTITQLFLETVHVTQRGIVSGVQNALNQLMDMFKFALVISLPAPEVFGYLVMISFCFICLGWVLFAIYVKKSRGYLLPCYAP